VLESWLGFDNRATQDAGFEPLDVFEA
jgi:hypothetical protein